MRFDLNNSRYIEENFNILALPNDRSWGMLEADRDVLLLDEFAFALPAAERLEGLGLTRGIINPAEAHDAPALRHKVGVIGRARHRRGKRRRSRSNRTARFAHWG
jgi:hypothetical protein